jgi:(p)ppGpp synthase/HD superfamily hydrolase
MWAYNSTHTMSSAAGLTSRFQDALDLAFRLHGHATRKASKVPVMAHLLGVCALVQQDGGSEDEAIAALLHDVLEDEPGHITRDDLRQRFGERVMAIIDAATDTPRDYRGGPKPPWRQRKEAYLAHARTADPALLRVTIADKVDNLRAMIRDYRRVGNALWWRFHAGRDEQLWYFRACMEAYRAAGCKGELMDELRCLLEQLTSLTG